MRRVCYWLWRLRIWISAHALPDFHRFYQAEIKRRRMSHKARAQLQSEYRARVHEALKQEVGK